MPKKKIVTTEEIDTNEAAPETIEMSAEPESPEVSELYAYLDGLSGNATVVKIFKVVEGEKAYCGKAEPGTINEDFILKRWGGGKYTLLAFLNGKFVAGGYKTINLFASDHTEENNGSKNADNSAAPQLMLLQEQLNRQHEMLLKMIESKSSGAPSMSEMIQMFVSMQTLAPKAPDITTMISPVLDLFSKTMDMARETAGGGDDKMSWLKLASGALEQLPKAIGQLTAGRRMVNNPPDEREAAPVDMQTMLLRQGLEWLKKKARAGKSVESVSDMLLENIDDEAFGPIAVYLLNQPFENLGKVDPEIMQEPIKTWFQNLYNDLKAALNEHNSLDTGASGSNADASGNETTNN